MRKVVLTLKESENIFVSVDEVRCILKERYILSPRSRKITRKNMKKLLLQQKALASSKKDVSKIQSSIKRVYETYCFYIC